MSRRRGPAIVEQPVDFGLAELVPDADRPGGWTLLVDGTPQSHVDLEDPTDILFEYLRRFADLVDTGWQPGAPLRALHLGGGALTLPRYIAATRPGSVQRVVERDAALIDLVRRELPLPRGADLRVRAADGRAALEQTGSGRYDLIVTDVFAGSRIPRQFASVEFVRQVARVLRPGGRYTVNIADSAPLRYAKAQVATLQAVFAEVCLIAEPGILRGRRYGNIVLAATGDAATGSATSANGTAGCAASSCAGLPVADLATRSARGPYPARVMSGTELVRFTGGAQPLTDETSEESPAPPAGMF